MEPTAADAASPPRQTNVDLTDCDVTDEAVQHLAQRAEALAYVNLSFARRLTERAVVTLAQGAPQLRKLVLQCVPVSDEATNTFIENRRQVAVETPTLWLKTALEWTSGHSAAGPVAALRVRRVVGMLPSKVTGRHVEGLALVLRHMTVVDLRHCSGLRGPAVQQLASLHQLRGLSVQGCRLITLEDLATASPSWPHLRVLDLGGTWQSAHENEPALFKSLLRSCSQLQTLGLSHTRFGDECADALTNSPVALTSEHSSIHVHMCPLSGKGLGVIRHHLPFLKVHTDETLIEVDDGLWARQGTAGAA